MTQEEFQEDVANSTATLLRKDQLEAATTLNGGVDLESDDHEKEEKTEAREGWDNKFQYLLAQVGFAVGLGNVWRFPYLCQKNGGGAFLIPYCIMLVLEGVPLFYMEIAIGQKLKKGSVGVWDHISPLLGGVGIASIIVCFLIALYYNVIISWALFYFFNSFQDPLPWSECPQIPVPNSTTNETTDLLECKISSATSYFWYRDTLDISNSISRPGHAVWRMSLVLFVAWCIVFIGMFKGIKSSGKVMYFSATFPYIVLLIYFFRGITLDGATDGLIHMFTPNMARLLDPEVWRDAATQIFFSLGLGFGGVIAYSSYNDTHNNCKKDALTVSFINCATSVFASVVIFCVLGFKANYRAQQCTDSNIIVIHDFFTNHHHDIGLNQVVENITRENYQNKLKEVTLFVVENNETYPETYQQWKHLNLSNCSIQDELKDGISGPGLAFIAFTEAMIHLPGAPFWSIMFFLMLINLGLGSMFGTLEGIVTPLKDLGFNVSKEAVVALLCLFSWLIGQVFTLRSGMYLLSIFDTYAGTVPLLLIAFFETVAISWIYGFKKFSADIESMLKEKPGLYWYLTWCYISPLCMAILFIASIVTLAIKTPQYKVYDPVTGTDEKVDYPGWAIGVIVCLIFCSIVWIPVVAIKRWKGRRSAIKSPERNPSKQVNHSYCNGGKINNIEMQTTA